VIGGGRTQVCPSTYLTRRIFFLLAKVLAPPQCVAQQRTLRTDEDVMFKIGTDHTHRHAPLPVWRPLSQPRAAQLCCVGPSARVTNEQRADRRCAGA
jgi:hypothetical protein